MFQDMTSHANLLMQHKPVAPGNIRYLALRVDGRQPVPEQRNKTSMLVLGLVIAVHVGAIYWLQTHKVELAKIEAPPPMMVSLLAAPQPEVAQIVPIIPKPVVKPQPKIEKVVPLPKPVQQETPEAVVQPPPPAEAAPSNSITPVVEQPTAEPKVEPKVVEEPKIEPPRFGVGLSE